MRPPTPLQPFNPAHRPVWRLSRAALVARIMADAGPVILIEGPAGTGKSWLLDDLRAAGEMRPVWDVPRGGGPLPDGPVILAKRTESPVVGLARAEIYGRVSRYGTEALLFSPDEMADPDLHARTGGWACLIPVATRGPPGSGVMEAFLRAELLAPLSSAALVGWQNWLAAPDGPPTTVDVPFAGLRAPLGAIAQPLTRALRATLAARAEDREEVRVIASALARCGRLPESIALSQRIGAWDAALAALAQSDGPFFIHRFGPAAFDRMLAGFPPDLSAGNDQLVLCRAIQAIKRGEVMLMRRILSDRWGPAIADASAVLIARDRYGLDVRFMRLLIRTWEDFDLDDRYLDGAYTVLAELPADDDLRRGSFYNAVLEYYIRDRRFAEADHVAVYAATHYDRAGIAILSFYIDLHRAVIQLFLGSPRAAARHAAAARIALTATPYDSPGDARLLALVDACIAYEGGTAEPLTRFLALEIDALAQGEVWPTLVELTLTYGTQALLDHWSTMAARSLLDRWRVTGARSSQFHKLIDIREVVVLQTAGRWAEAATRAAVIPGRITQGFVQGAGAALTGLSDRDEVALALVWLRHLAQVSPGLPGLGAALTGMLDNPHLTARQRFGAEIWRAYVLRRTRAGAEAEAQLRRTLTAAAEEGAVAALTEERIFLTDLLSAPRLRTALDRIEPVRRLLRQLTETGHGPHSAARAAGLTRQEARVLKALGEGATNKAVAKLLGLSEATVKFHLANLYRKLGCSTRGDAVRAANALRLLA